MSGELVLGIVTLLAVTLTLAMEMFLRWLLD